MRRVPQDGIVGLAALREAATGEFRQIIELVQAALVVKLGLPSERTWMVSIEAMYADRAIVRRDGRYWAYPYTLAADNTVQMGEPTEVLETYVPVALREAEAGTAFVEAREASGLEWDAVLIRAGLSLNGTFYSDAVLREAVALFEGARVFAKPDAMHVKGDGKDVNRIVGWMDQVKFVEGQKADTGRMLGRFNFAAGAAQLRETVTDAWKRGKRDLVGFSIDADGTAKAEMREGKRVRVARSIKKVNSVDLIVDPSAGGGLVRLVEAADPKEQSEMALKDKMMAKVKAKFPNLDVASLDDDALEARYAEAVALEAGPAPTGAAETVTRAEVEERMRMIEARGVARALIAGAKLPEAAKDKLQADFAVRASFTEADVSAAIKAEREYLAKFTESGTVQLAGLADVEVEDRSAKVAGMLDAFFDPKHKDHRATHSFKECYIEMTGDRRVTGRLENCDRTRMAESLGAAFREGLDSTALADVLGSALRRTLLADYREMGQYDVWRHACSVVPVADFRTNERTRFGGYGDLPAVSAGDPYTALTSPSDEKASYAVSKRGGTEDITLEMIKNDDVGVIRRVPIKLSRSAKRTLAKFVLDFVRTNPTIYDSVAFFHNDHSNLGANALDATYLAAARLRMLKQTEAGSLDRIGIGPKYLWVPPDLQETGVNLFNRSTNNDKTFVQDLSLQVMPVWYWSDANDWAISADPMDIPGIEIGFLDGNEEPEIFVQDNPTVGSMFSADKLTWKIRHVYGGDVVEYRGWDKSVL